MQHLDKATVEKLNAEAATLLGELAARYGMTFATRKNSCRWGDGFVQLKFELVQQAMAPSASKSAYVPTPRELASLELGAARAGIDATKILEQGSKKYKIVGYNQRKRTAPYIIEDMVTGKLHCATVAFVLASGGKVTK